jgi:hypothetical protein
MYIQAKTVPISNNFAIFANINFPAAFTRLSGGGAGGGFHLSTLPIRSACFKTLRNETRERFIMKLRADSGKNNTESAGETTGNSGVK